MSQYVFYNDTSKLLLNKERSAVEVRKEFYMEYIK